ncbi:insulinase family protein [Aggregicoccus sp. 17bor-14]|nr:insulinase family protein [Simulacricoccus sp. 17bor-14]MRI90744.1 insulinase family protein [Aggregicoccus sp. 17bor-14]
MLAAGSLACGGPKAAQRTEAPAAPPPAAPAAQAAPPRQEAPAQPAFQVPVEYHTLDNGLKVVLSRDATAPKVAVAVYYNIGFRIEPRDRTGFAHLFEHMMFQGSKNLGKNAFIGLVQANGGILNGSTRFDFTNYFEIVPSHTLETMLWAEADRMRGLAVTQDNLVNQQNVVKNEVRVNVLNQPYGGFPWLDMPQHANTNWYNAHNFYGDLKDLDAATLEDVQSFFKTYYAPNNAALVLVGDFEPAQALAWVQKYFGNLPRAQLPAQPDITEPRQEEERRAEKVDALAQRPALAVAYHVPQRNTPEFYAMVLLHELLLDGKDSALYQNLVQQKQLTGDVSGGINLLGNPFDYNGPMLWTVALFHDPDKTPEQLVQAMDESIERVRTQPVDAASLERARVKVRSDLYGQLEQTFGFGTADLLASFALFDNDPGRINRLEGELLKVTPELIQKTAQEYLRPTNRTVLVVKTKPKS